MSVIGGEIKGLTEEIVEHLEECVKYGIEWLDKNYNSGRYWIWSVNPETLDMYSTYNCMIGQLFGGYQVTYNGDSPYYIENTDMYGFSCDMIADESAMTTGQMYELLTGIWTDQIYELREQMTKRG